MSDPGVVIDVRAVTTMAEARAILVGLDWWVSRCGLHSRVLRYMGEAKASGESSGDEGGDGGGQASPGSPTGLQQREKTIA